MDCEADGHGLRLKFSCYAYKNYRRNYYALCPLMNIALRLLMYLWMSADVRQNSLLIALTYLFSREI